MNWDKLLSTKRIRKSSKVDSSDVRNQYESDLGRIIYSPALRRMHDKTQVFPLTTDDNIHTRLTHSTEVMSLSYTFGLKCATNEAIKFKTKKTTEELLREIPIVLQSISFIHDIGNPPFGHFAEEVIANYFDTIEDNSFLPASAKSAFNNLTSRQQNDFKFFDGNAQGLRVLTKLQYLDDIFGMNLTYAVLGSYLKYPNYFDANINKLEEEGKNVLKKKKNNNIGASKHGIFYSEETLFKKIIKECGLNKDGGPIRHPLCYLMEAADSIAYLVMDIEDGFSKGYVTINCIKNEFTKIKDSEGKLVKVANSVLDICDREHTNDENKMIFIRIALIDYLVNLAFDNFVKNLDKIETGLYNKELIEDDNDKISKILSKICFNQIFSSREINHLETTGHSVIKGLLDHYISQLFHSNTKFVNRATALISSSTIKVALEENMPSFIEEKVEKLLKEVNLELTQEKNEQEKQFLILRREKLDTLKKKVLEYLQLIEQGDELVEIDYNPIKKLRNEIFKAFSTVSKPISFSDLSDYFKFRVVIDFITGMTDQYALSHFQKISGQKIA